MTHGQGRTRGSVFLWQKGGIMFPVNITDDTLGRV